MSQVLPLPLATQLIPSHPVVPVRQPIPLHLAVLVRRLIQLLQVALALLTKVCQLLQVVESLLRRSYCRLKSGLRFSSLHQLIQAGVIDRRQIQATTGPKEVILPIRCLRLPAIPAVDRSCRQSIRAGNLCLLALRRHLAQSRRHQQREHLCRQRLNQRGNLRLLWITFLIGLAQVCLGSPFLVADPYPAGQNQFVTPVSFILKGLSANPISVPATTNQDGTVQLHYDLASLGNGSYTVVADAVNVFGGVSPDSSPFVFTVGVPAAPTTLRIVP